MIEVKKPTNFFLTKDADDAGKDIIKELGNINQISILAPLAISLIISSKDESHYLINDKSITGGVHKGRLNDYENHEALALLYKSTFKDSDPEDIWINVQKAASAGILLIKSKYFTHQKLIDWEAINKEFL